MTDILFVSETNIHPNLELVLEELIAQKIRISKSLDFLSATNHLKSNFFETVIINGDGKKLDSYELCREIKANFRNAIKVYVFIADANANEGSKFGLVEAEVEDKDSIKNLANKIYSKKQKNIEIEENIISFYSPYGGLGLSSLCSLTAYTLDHLNKTSLILETNENQTIKRNFGFGDSLAFSNQEQNSLNQDLDWFYGFISKTSLMPNVHYLNLFNSIIDKAELNQKLTNKLDELIQELEKASPNTRLIHSSLKLINKELRGESLSLFNQIIQTGSKLTENFLFDLGRDISSPINKQLLRYSQNLVILLKDSQHLKEEFSDLKKYFSQLGIKNLIPVLAANSFNKNFLSKINNDEWLELLGEIPLLYSYSPEEFFGLVGDNRKLANNSKLLDNCKKLLKACNIKTETLLDDSNKGILKFLVNNF